MVKGKIFYDNTIRTREEWEKSINVLRKDFQNIIFPDTDELSYLDSVQSHYFAIVNNKPKEIRLKIRNQMKRELGEWLPIVWDAVLDSGKNCEFYRIDVPRMLVVYTGGIYNNENLWIKKPDLHSKGQRAISNLIRKLESGEV